MPTLAGNKHLSVHFFPHGPRFSIFRQKKVRSDPSEMDIKVVIPAPTQKIKSYTKDQGYFHKWKIIENTVRVNKNAWNKYILMLEIFMITCGVC